MPRIHFDFEMGALLPLNSRRWFQWGYLTRDGVRQSWYWLLRLPSFAPQPCIYRGPSAPWTMHQLCLLWHEPLAGPFGGEHGLKHVYLECVEE